MIDLIEFTRMVLTILKSSEPIIYTSDGTEEWI